MSVIKKMDFFIMGKYLYSLLITSTAFLVIFFVVDVVENLRKLLDSNASSGAAILYSVLNLPFLFSLSLPIAMLLAAVFSFSSLVKHNETVALKSAGVSLYRLLLPIVIIGFIVSVGSFYFTETIVTKSNRERLDLAREYSLRGVKKLRSKKYNIFLQDGPARNVAIGVYKFKNDTGDRVNIQYFDGESLVQRIDSKVIRWVPDSSRWVLENSVIRHFDMGVESIEKTTQIDSIRFNFTPETLRKGSMKPEEMSYWELGEFVEALKANGIDARKWSVNHKFKISFAFTNLVVVLFGIPLAANKRPGGAAFGVGVALFFCFIYYGLLKLGQSLAKNGSLEATTGVWAGNIIFLIVSAIMIFRASK